MSELALDPVRNLQALLRCASVTPVDDGALAALAAMLEPMGFACRVERFEEAGTPAVANLLATRGASGPHLAFAGHTDVVPPGDASRWRHPPFAGAIENGELFGRGAVDMKGGIACFVAALARLHARGALPEGRVSLLVTGDEEGPAINGTVKLLDFAERRGHRFDACLVGEPTNPNAVGDMVKIGRRGSLSGTLALEGRQGHVAYPHLALNPMRHLEAVLAALHAPLDEGTEAFQPSNLEVTAIDTGNASTNVVPARTSLRFNVRFNDRWTGDALKREIARRIDAALGPSGVTAALEWREPVSDCFRTEPGALTEALCAAVEEVTMRRPELSTSGGTSDARFIKNHCPVVEFGLVGRTMHMVDERVALSDLETLTAVYETFVARWFAAHA